MALLHRAELRPTKLELLAAWLPDRPWYSEPTAADPQRVAGYRFDDPAGQVGIETILVRVGDGPVYQVPLTYRGAPLDGGDEGLVGTVHHSVLGRRWVYDGCGDPVYAAALARAVLADTGQAEEFYETDGGRERRSASMTVGSSGTATAEEVPSVGAIHRVVPDDPTLIEVDSLTLTVVRRLDAGNRLTGAVLTGTVLTDAWHGQPAPLALACATSTVPAPVADPGLTSD